jgi:ketosteroid isomerase-like protein
MEFKEFDLCLSDLERRNVVAAYEMIDAMRNCWIDPQAGRLQLERLLAEEFISFTPTSDPARQQVLDKQAFINHIRNQRRRLKPESRLEIVAHTAHGNRVATEMSSDMVYEDGSWIRNRCHQLFLFNSASKIAEYRTYMDSAAVVDSAIVRGEALVRDFIVALGDASPDFKRLTTKHFEFHAADGSSSIGADSLLEKIAVMRQRVGKFSLRPIDGGLVVGEGMASVEAQAPTGFVHSFVVSFDDDYVTSAIEFSSGILEMRP